MDNSVTLRCKHCGAPFDRKDVESDSPYVTCQSCGTTQQRVDAKAYLDQMMGQIQSWISKSLPGGFSLSQSENVDSVARFNIFNNSVRPKIEMEYTEYRFAANTLLSNALMVLPFTTNGTIPLVHNSNQAFEFNARAKSVMPLAVDDGSRVIVGSAENLATAYALLINNVKLLQEDKPGRYILLGKNFKEASDAFSKVKDYGLASKRFDALALICTGCEKLVGGDVMGSTSFFDNGIAGLEAVKNNVMLDLNLGIMFRAVEMEISQAAILKEISRFVTNGVADDPLYILNIIKKVFGYRFPQTGKWAFFFSNNDRYNEIFGYLTDVIKAKGGGTLPIAAGSGSVLVPFWDVDLKYSFQTGSLWNKKSVEVVEDILVPADFVIDAECLSNPSSAVTDIFAVRPTTKIMDGLAGRETSISGGEGITKMSQFAQNSPGARKVVLPLSTKQEAEKVVAEYLLQRTSSDSQLKLSKPAVKGLIYIPCEMDSVIKVPAGFGALVPKRVMRAKPSDLIVI